MEWISVNDRLPNTNGHYLIYISDAIAYKIRLARYCCEKNKWRPAEANACFEGVTHWSELPEPPET